MAFPQQPPITAPVITPVPSPVTTSTSVPASSPPPGPTKKPEEGTSNFSVVDAAGVVMRGLSTVTECLCFAGRKVTVYAITLGGWLAGGIKGLFRYAHENLNNRTVQPVPSEKQDPTPDSTISGKMPLEEYVRKDALSVSNSLSKSLLTTNQKNPWLSVEGFGGIVFAAFTPYVIFGPLATLLNLPRLCGVEPFITFPPPANTPPESQPAPLLPALSSADSNPQQGRPPAQQQRQPESINPVIAPVQNPASQPAQPGLNNQQSAPPPLASQPSQSPVNPQAPQQSYCQQGHYTVSGPQLVQQHPNTSAPHYPNLISKTSLLRPFSKPRCHRKSHNQASQ